MSAHSEVRHWYNERQQYKKVPTVDAEQKELRRGRRHTQSSSNSAPQTNRQHQHPPPHPSTSNSSESSNPAHVHALTTWTAHLRRAWTVVAVIGIPIFILTLIVTLVMLTEKLRALAAVITSPSCSAG
ncbi:hypothetical protein DL93DRAFT_2173000 [Clavulina sp. PMI_390]|nr:hypothetical protein DL93DRAFT_2173000 [Clavulina sp. PMI_390]